MASGTRPRGLGLVVTTQAAMRRICVMHGQGQLNLPAFFISGLRVAFGTSFECLVVACAAAVGFLLMSHVIERHRVHVPLHRIIRRVA